MEFGIAFCVDQSAPLPEWVPSVSVKGPNLKLMLSSLGSDDDNSLSSSSEFLWRKLLRIWNKFKPQRMFWPFLF